MGTDGLAADGGGSERAEGGNITQRRKDSRERSFLDALAEGHTVRGASRIAGMSHTEFYRRRQIDVEFAQAWEDAENAGIEALEEEAHRRAYRGVERDIYYQGEVVGQQQLYSDQLLMFLLKAKRPDRYRESSMAVSISSESHATIEVRFVDQFRLGSE